MNMKSVIGIALFIVMVIAAQTPAFATTSDSLMCSEGIVSIRDIAPDLLRKCGQPAYAAQREQKVVEEGSYPGERKITTIIIDDWTFNFGPNAFQYRVLLKNGGVWSIEGLDYGY